MPEGHVIHRLARELRTHFADTTPEVSSPQGRFAAQASLIDGHRLVGAQAFGKHLFVEFDSPTSERIVYIHLGLIGKLHFEPLAETKGQIRLRIAGEDVAANLRGPQWCRLITEEDEGVAVGKLGEDPLRADADPERVRAKVARSNRSIGSLLMDQHLFAGVGNIFRAETLFRLGISPFMPGRELGERFDAVWEDLTGLMAYGVDHGRIDTVRPEHTPEAIGRPPRKDDHGGEVYVYRRAGMPCHVCGTPILEKVMEGRNLFWCPACQPEP